MPAWFLIRKGGDFQEIGRKHHIPTAAARLIRNRGAVTDEDFELYLRGGMECLHDPALFKDMDTACRLMADAVVSKEKIRVIGDYDIDGVCSAAILLKGLRRLSADVDAVIPHRVHDGYGMNSEMIRKAYLDGVKVIITCDNGIAASKEAALAKDLGITLVITDHHEVPYEESDGVRKYIIPDADAVVDPKQEDCSYPFSGICGGMVAYKFVSYLYNNRMCGEEFSDVYSDTRFMDELTELAAFATVGDIMELRDENRVIVKRGLELINSDPAPGIKELIEASGLSGTKISAYHLGFVLGPCINATGRIDSAQRALDLLTENDHENAMRIAGELRSMNESRKAMTEEAVKEAVEQVESGEFEGMNVLVIFLPDCHESIAGITAGRIRERYGKPVFIVTRGEEGLKGSGRSVDSYNMYEAMNEVKDVFTKFGGHAQAAGFSLEEDRLCEMRERLNANCKLTPEELRGKLMIDMELPLGYVNEDLLAALELMEPFGNGNSRPVFAKRNIFLTGISVMGQKRNSARLRVVDDNTRTEMVLFKKLEDFEKQIAEKYGEDVVKSLEENRSVAVEVRFAAAYSAQWNEFRGVKKIQMAVEDYIL